MPSFSDPQSLDFHGLFARYPVSVPWQVGCNEYRGRPLPDKGKPVARRGRKAMGQATGLIAGLPKRGRVTRALGIMAVFLKQGGPRVSQISSVTTQRSLDPRH